MRPHNLISFAATAALSSPVTAMTLAEMLAAQNATLSILNGFLEQQQALFNAFSSTPDITVLAPSNAALSSLPDEVVDRVSSDPAYLTALLSYHVLNGTYYASQLTASTEPLVIRTLLNSSAYANVSGGQRVVAQLLESDEVILYSGGGAGTTIQTRDYNFTGGTVHIIDGMLSLPASLSDTLLARNMTAAVGAIRESGMGDGLDAAGEVTVFAPTNAAFEAVGSLVADMTDDQFTNVLAYHVVQGAVMYSGMMGNGTAVATQGTSLTFLAAEEGGMFVNGARVVEADVLIANGVLHFIDAVLNPENSEATPDPTASTQAPEFSGASATGGVPFTTGVVVPPPPLSSTSRAVTATITVGPVVTGSGVMDTVDMVLLILFGFLGAIFNI
ncbi:FAS1 domain-containing protein [Echria macrotheca]|uniref:FAS1 domain-containing protein n=1 Tax=Echria macrotheca TaxID=438768 RepID=A0AAJ0FDE0_9PEZI|nr:FAS1 domain-containing protein [Echria macrotheca]